MLMVTFLFLFFCSNLCCMMVEVASGAQQLRKKNAINFKPKIVLKNNKHVYKIVDGVRNVRLLVTSSSSDGKLYPNLKDPIHKGD